MVERRSLGEALSTPEKLAFIKGQSETGSKPSPAKVQASKETVIDLSATEVAIEKTETRAPRLTRRSRNERSRQDAPDAHDVLDKVLVPMTFRLPHRIAQAIKRAYLEQKLNHKKPDTVQEIGEEALSEWLENAGYLD
jgi:hypothetical protein